MEDVYDNLIISDANFVGDRLYISWECDSVGFGQLVVEMSDNQLQFDTEMMGPRFTKAVMCALVDYGTIV